MAALPIDDEVCTYRGCDAAAVSRFTTAWGGQPWFACDDHAKAMMSAMGVGLSASEGVHEDELDRLTPKRG